MRPCHNNNGYRLPGLTAPPEGGFALIAAILACMVLLALGMLVINLSTQDLRVSAKLVGDKKALSAVEVGIHAMSQTFNPENLAASASTNVQVDAANDPATTYTIGTPVPPTSGSGVVPLTGYSIGGGQQWGQKRYDVAITGQNTAYGTRVDVTTGLGYGPIEITTMSR
ncbi:MAG: pilus assembly PilX N-terminal domain-containing protein [Deltaproteobacteria bacterium]|nr:pilus assembly PilX N-terminal domain-containing protein [Deltaproteobacteria bacterium]